LHDFYLADEQELGAQRQRGSKSAFASGIRQSNRFAQASIRCCSATDLTTLWVVAAIAVVFFEEFLQQFFGVVCKVDFERAGAVAVREPARVGDLGLE
jgi:hypothetical protein